MKPLVWQTSGITAPHNPSSPLPKPPTPVCIIPRGAAGRSTAATTRSEESLQRTDPEILRVSFRYTKKKQKHGKRVKLQAKMTKISKSIKHIWWHLMIYMHAKTLSLCYEGGSLGTKVHRHGNLCCRINLLQMSACLKFEIKKVWNHCLRTNQFYREQLQHS